MDTSFLEIGEESEAMESVYQPCVGSRRTDKYEDIKQNLISCSNAIYFATSPFYQLSANAKSILGIKKAG